MRSRTLAGAAALAVGLLSLGACSSSDPEEPSGDPTGGSVETMYGTVEVPVPDDGELTVVSLGWSDADVALALGVKPVAVFDWQGFGEEAKGVGPWATDLFGDTTPTVIPNAGQALNYEQIQGLDPDLILNVSAAADQDVYDRLSSIAPTVYAPEGTPDYATSWDVQVRSIAAAVGLSDEGEDVIADVQAQIDASADANPEFAGHTAASGTKFGDAYGAYTAGDGRFDILADLGFVQNPPILALPSSGFYTAISAENISALDADVSIFLPIGYTLEETKSDPLLASLESVKAGRAIFIDPESELSGAWGARSVLSIPVVLETMVPDLATAVSKLG